MVLAAGERPTFPLEAANDWRESFRSYDVWPDYDDPEFAPYKVGEFIFVRHFSVRVGLIVKVSHFDCFTGSEQTPDGKLAKYLVRLLNNDGTFAKRSLWATPGAMHRAYECTYNNETGEKRSFPPFLIEAFVKELRKW